MLQITVLGCGSSLGVPVIGCECKVCKSSLPYNKRTRSAILIQNDETKILVDFGFEIREQLIRAGVKSLDAAILTHDHADHVSGIDNLRVFPFIQKKILNIYTEQNTAKNIVNRYPYLFSGSILKTIPTNFYSDIEIGNINIQFFKQIHSNIDSLGLRIGNFVYSCDVSDFPEQSQEYLNNIETWIVDCVGYKSSKDHAGLDKVFEWNDKYKPGRILLTNMRHDIDYMEVIKALPKNITPLYDGYQFKI